MSSPRPYAADTSVSVEKSRAELETLLAKHGATQRAVMTDDGRGRAVVAFVIHDRQYRLELPLPKLADYDKQRPGGGHAWRMSNNQIAAWRQKECDQACRTRWRAFVQLVKSKLELVRIGATTVEREFLADLVLPDGATVGRMIESQIEQIQSGIQPRLLTEGVHP